MSTARDYLAAVQQRADAAAGGPWYEREGYVCRDAVYSDGEEFVQGIAAYPVGKSAEFIVAARTDVPRLVAALGAALDLAEWHETKADKARLYPGPGHENALVMTKSAAVHDDAARRLRAAITDALTPKENDS
ncbi:hypothetical protein ABRQ22_17345 [Cellulosimicrobium sp. ES-005]|uniref:Uncharacterized protein n=1 Tax=Cellulosimicrobium sp. ES-005 TaxID=3163031 RepID=A0AAU8FXE5_9MICO